MFRRKTRSAVAVLFSACLIATVFQSVPASADTTVATPLKVNFQLATTVTPSGYLADYGQAYDATRGYGWVAQSDGTPLDLVGNGRERGVVGADKRLDTFMMPQSLPSSGIDTIGAWKANVPNGKYNVTVGVGDSQYSDSVDVVNVEGVKIVNFTPTDATPQATSAGVVTVSDGVLNVDEVGGTNTKIDYIDAVPTTTTSPSATPVVTVTPSGTKDSSGNYVGSATVTIAASETGGTIVSTKYSVDGGAAQTYTAPFAVSTVGSHNVVATATDAKNVSTSASAAFSVVASGDTSSGTTARYEFGIATTSTVSGYTLDYGRAFDTARGYGWENLASGAPLSYEGNGRDRGVNSNKLLDRLIQPQTVASSSGTHTDGKWEAVVVNGTYDVTIGVGDPSYTDSKDVWNIEGVQAINFTPTVATPQATATKTVTVTDGRLTLDPTGGTNSKIDYITILPSGTTNPPASDVTPPTVSVAVNGTTNSSGAYLDTATVAITAADAGGVKSISYTLDGGAATTYSRPFAVATAGTHTVVAKATDNANNTSAAVTKTFTVTPSAGTTQKPTSLSVVTPQDNLNLGSRLVFSTVYNQQRACKSFTITNKGTATLNITALTPTAPFQLCASPAQASSFTLAANASKTVSVQYRPTVDAETQGTQVDQGTLTIKSNDATVPNYVVTLGGVDTQNYENAQEANLQQVFNAMGYTTNAAVSNEPQENSVSSTASAVGDEVLAPYFKALDAAKAVNLVPVAHYSGIDGSDSNAFGWYSYGSSSSNYLYSYAGGDSSGGANNGYGQNQLLTPDIKKCSGCSGVTSFNPTGSFGIVDPYPGYTSHTDDNLNEGKWHDIRVYPAKDANGKVIAGTYLLADDIGQPNNNSAKNWDHQDFVWLLTNATPDTTKTPLAPGLQNKTVSSFGSAGGLSGTGFTTYQANKSDASKVAVTNGQLKITTTNDTNSSHTNALQVPVNSGDRFFVSSRLVGPFDAINAGSEQQGIFWGPDATHYVKAELDWQGTSRNVTVWVQNGSGDSNGTQKFSVALPNATGTNNASTLDLRIAIDPSPQQTEYYGGDPRVNVSYATNGGGYVAVGSAFTIPSSWATAQTPAGVMTSSQGGSSFVATYGNFAVGRDYEN